MDLLVVLAFVVEAAAAAVEVAHQFEVLQMVVASVLEEHLVVAAVEVGILVPVEEYHQVVAPHTETALDHVAALVVCADEGGPSLAALEDNQEAPVAVVEAAVAAAVVVLEVHRRNGAAALVLDHSDQVVVGSLEEGLGHWGHRDCILVGDAVLVVVVQNPGIQVEAYFQVA